MKGDGKLGLFFEVGKLSLLSMFRVFLNPFFWGILFFIYMQNKKAYKRMVKITGRGRKSLKYMFFKSLGIGLLGGLIGTAVIMFFGVTIHTKDFYYILPLAVFLMLFNVRYICFSYAGGMLCLISFIFGVPKLNISSILAVVAILHLVESILIYFDGYEGAIPIFIEDKNYGLIGGFTLQRFWPIPFAVLFLGQAYGDPSNSSWWPFFKENVAYFSLQITSIVAALGYGDFALTNTPREKCKKSAKRLLIYSIILLCLSIISTKVYMFKLIAALFAPLAHEGLIIYAQKEEKRGTPIFRRRRNGVTVLEVYEDGIGMKMGICKGDVIVSINNYMVHEKEDIKNILSLYSPNIRIEVIDIKGIKKILNYSGVAVSLDILVIPKNSQVIFERKDSMSILKKVLGMRKTM